MKKILGIRSAPDRHWVGDGFPVYGLFGYSGADVPQRSPFLLLDYAAPTHFDPSNTAIPPAGAGSSVPATCSG